MDNPNRGEVGFSCDLEFEEGTSLKDGHFALTLKMNNAGRRAMEGFLGLEYPQVEAKLEQGILGSRIMTGLFMAATRKHHAREFPSIQSCDEFMDAIEEADDETQVEFHVALLAANARVTKDAMRERLGLSEEDLAEVSEEDQEDEEDAGSPDAEPELPKDPKAPAASRRGKGSRKKGSDEAA